MLAEDKALDIVSAVTPWNRACADQITVKIIYTTRRDATAAGPQCGIIRGVSRETAINDDGSVFTRELNHDLLQHDAAASDATRAPWPARAEVPFDRRPGRVPLSGGAFFADVNTVAS